jgi:hypothetical protein
MARRRKPEEPVQALAEVEVVETFPEKKQEPAPEPKTETKRPSDAVLGYMRDRYGYF